MNCPYCSEEIKPQAIICKHCNKDLSLISPILVILDRLELEVQDLKTKLGAYESKPSAHQNIQARVETTIPNPPLPGMVFLASIALACSVSIGAYYFFYTSDFEPPAWLIISIVSPLPFGLWLGYKWRRMKIITYVVGGFFIGLVNMIGAFAVYGSFSLDDPDLEIATGLYVLGGILLYLSGGIIGTGLGRKNNAVVSNGLSEKIARNIVSHKPHSPTENDEFELKVGRLKKVIETLGPVLTFVASIVTAYLTYSAATGGK